MSAPAGPNAGLVEEARREISRSEIVRAGCVVNGHGDPSLNDYARLAETTKRLVNALASTPPAPSADHCPICNGPCSGRCGWEDGSAPSAVPAGWAEADVKRVLNAHTSYLVDRVAEYDGPMNDSIFYRLQVANAMGAMRAALAAAAPPPPEPPTREAVATLIRHHCWGVTREGNICVRDVQGVDKAANAILRLFVR